MTKLVEYLATAKMCNYSRPNKPLEQWSDTEFFDDSFYITLNTPTQLQALMIMCNQNSFSMIYFKRTAKDYIARFSS